MPLHLGKALKVTETPDKPDLIDKLPQELRAYVAAYVVEDQVAKYKFLWLLPYEHQGKPYVGIPNQVSLANCTHNLHDTITPVLISKYTVCATLSLDGAYCLDLEDTLSKVGEQYTKTITSLKLVVHGGSRMSMHALYKWARLSYDGPLARDSKLRIIYDLEGCWDNGYDPCGNIHNAYIKTVLKDLQHMAFCARKNLTGNTPTAAEVEAFGQQIHVHMDKMGWCLPSTPFCRGVTFNGRCFEHTEESDSEGEEDD